MVLLGGVHLFLLVLTQPQAEFEPPARLLAVPLSAAILLAIRVQLYVHLWGQFSVVARHRLMSIIIKQIQLLLATVLVFR